MITQAAPEARTRFIPHKDFQVILLDYSEIPEHQQALEAIEASKQFFAKLAPDASQYTMTDVRRTHYDREIVDALKALAAHNRPYVRAAAIVTDSRMQRTLASLVGIFSGRKLAAFETREEALEYLAQQHAAATGS